MNIYISMENKVRELEGRLLLALVAAERGHSVILGSKAATTKPAVRGRLSPGILHLKCIASYDPGVTKLDMLLRRGHVVTTQDEEHGLLYDSHETFARNRYEVATVARVARIFAWGPHDGDTLRQMYGIDDETRRKIVDTGSPRVDFWRRDFASYYTAATPEGIRNRGGYLLIVSNMMRAFSPYPFWDMAWRWREDGFFRNEEAEMEWYAYTCWQVRVVADFLRMVRVLSRTFPDTPIVIRPHAAEHKNAWPFVIGDLPNVQVIRSGSLSPWIRSAKAIIQNGCTSGFEAAIAGVPVFAYTTQDTEFDRSVANRVTMRVRTLDALLDGIEQVLDGRVSSLDHTERDAILRARFANLEGRLAADRIVDEWERLHSEKLETPNDFRSIRVREWWRGVKMAMRRAGLRRFRRKSLPMQSPALEFGYLHDWELTSIHEGLQTSFGRFANVEMARLGPSSFLLSGRKGA